VKLLTILLKDFSLVYGGVKLYFGLKSIKKLREYVGDYEEVVIAAGKSSAKVSGALNDVISVLKKYEVNYEVFDKITPNPWAKQADELAEVVWSCGADAVIAIGGGSVIDTAKVSSVIAASGGKAVDYLLRKKKPRYMIPLIAINLTHGTGTEVDRYAVLTIEETLEKRGISIRYPNVSFDNPKYLVTLPKNQTVYTSLDAFYHAYEAVTAKTLSSPFIELISLEPIKLIKTWLPKALRNPYNLRARYWLQYASMLAGIAIDASSTHIVHAIEHALSGLNPKLPHGCGLGIIGARSAYYIHKTKPRESALLLKKLNPKIKPNAEYANEAEKTVREFQREFGFEESLSNYGFTEKDVDTVVKLLFNGLRYLWDESPLELTANIVRDILEKSF